MTSSPPADVQCLDYLPENASRRCQRYLAGGGCALAGHDECVVWRRINPKARRVSPLASPQHTDARTVVELTPAQVTSFRDLGVEVCVDSPGMGEIWLVPTHTDLPRCELTPEEAAKVADILRTFPGAGVADMRLLPRD